VKETQTDEFLVIYHNCGNCTLKQIDSIATNGCRVLHFGNSIDMEEMLKKAPSDLLVMGNIDAATQFRKGTPESIRSAATALLEKCSRFPNFVISSGCDIPPLSGWDNIQAFFEAVHDFYAAQD
jgi:uroporphyrinogen decarboxylase